MALSRRAWAAVVAGPVLVQVGPVLVLLGSSGGLSPQRPVASGPVATYAHTSPGSVVALGAWVKPGIATDAARVAAIAGVESAIGRPLDLLRVYDATSR
jgi:hypothetical protein